MSTFTENIIRIYGEHGKLWLLELSNITQQYKELWDLHDLNPLNNLSYSYVMSGYQQAKPIILKLGPDTETMGREHMALRTFSGYGVAAVLAQDTGAALLQRAVPGHSLKNYFPDREEEALKAACLVLNKLHQAPLVADHKFPQLTDWLQVFEDNWDIPQYYLEAAKHLRPKLLIANRPSVLLHGDFHHDNILSNGTEWLVVDPKGVVGDPAYDAAVFINNPIPELIAAPNTHEIFHHRTQTFARCLGVDSRYILRWCFIQAVIGYIWALQDGIGTTYWRNLLKINWPQEQLIELLAE